MSAHQNARDCLDHHLTVAHRREQEAILTVTNSESNIQSAGEMAVDSDIGPLMTDFELQAAEARRGREAVEEAKANLKVLLEAASVEARDDEKAEAQAVKYAMRAAQGGA